VTTTAVLPDPRFTSLGVYGKTVLENPYIFHKPTPKQAKVLMGPHREALFGGAAGGGKSDALLMAALQYVHEPEYSALILRKSYKHLAQPGAIMDRMKQWHATWTRELGLQATWNANDKAMTFPSGARILFGHIAYENEKYNYLGAEYATRPAGPTQGCATAWCAHRAVP